MLSSLLAIVAAVALSWWSWRDRFDRPLARWAAAARAVALAALLLLLVDPGVASHRSSARALVLLDHSLSMHASGGRWAEAASAAAVLGDTVAFGELARGEPGGQSLLAAPLANAMASGRQVMVVSDGEIGDASLVEPAALAQASARLFPRPHASDVAIVEVTGPDRLAAGDTLSLDVDLARTADAPDSAVIVVRDSNTVLLHGVARFGRSLHTRLHLTAAIALGLQGERWLRVERTGPADGEAGDDIRLRRLIVTAAPGIVVLAESPDWDGRALYRTLRDVVDAPIRGYVQLQHGEWRRMDDLRPVAAPEVTSAARAATLLAVRGDVSGWRNAGRARLLWPHGDQGGDWYVSPGGISPLSGAFAGVEADSLPPIVSVHPLPTNVASGWIGVTARLARRGAPVPIIGGEEDRNGRTVTLAADGLYRWPLKGGVAEQIWRTMIADAANWLLAARGNDSARARPVTPVTQRGRPVEFRWSGSGSATMLPIALDGPRGRVVDSLRFDGNGNAALPLGVGRYHYSLASGGEGTFAVEAYSDELVPSPVTLQEHAGETTVVAPRRSLRELLWLFGVAIAGFAAEWMLRRRMGLR